MNTPFRPVPRKILLDSGRRRQDERLPLDGSVPLPLKPFDPLDDESKPPQEDNVPTGVYERKKKAEGEQSTTTKARPKKRAKTAPATRMPRSAGGARFYLGDDGSLQIATADCTGRLSAKDATDLFAFIGEKSLRRKMP
jgi:hypothetical protein